MQWFWIGLVSLLASGLTFFSGFGLGTLLTPVMALFFPIEIAIALTGVVHLLNNLFKGYLMGKYVEMDLLKKFGIPSLLGALMGAMLLNYVSGKAWVLFTYNFAKNVHEITVLKLAVALLILIFTLIDISPKLKDKRFPAQYLGWGGWVSGFFGGFSGNQGALRSMFLLKSGLSKEQFLATGIAIACLVDISRLSLYFTQPKRWDYVQSELITVTIATLCAFLGAYIGNQLLKKTTLLHLQQIVSLFLILIAIGLGTGLL